MPESHPCLVCGLRPVVYAAACRICYQAQYQARKRREAGVPLLNRQAGLTCRDCGERPAVKRDQCHRCYMRTWQRRRTEARRKLRAPLDERRGTCYDGRDMSTTEAPMTTAGLLGMNVMAAAQELGVHKATVYRWLEQGKLSRLRGIGGDTPIVSAESVDRLKAERAAHRAAHRGGAAQ